MCSFKLRTLNIVIFAAFCISAGMLSPANAQNSTAADITVTLLGTGSPIPDPARMNAMTLVRAGQEVLLFDAGRGVVERLSQANVKGKDITAVFLTHFHSDHTVGLPDLWLTSRLRVGWWGGRTTPLEVWGPTGNAEFMQSLTKAFTSDIHARPKDTQIELVGHEFSQDGVVFNRNGVKVTAFTVDHGATKPAVGYRIDYNGRAVLLSGDTRYDENVVKYGTGVDLLLHEVLVVNPEFLAAHPELKPIFDHHTSPEQCGKVFTRAKPKLAAFTHIVFFGGPAFGSPDPAPTVQEMMQEARTTYRGPLEAGVDMMTFEIGDKVTVRPPMDNGRIP
jgi:ribonuclease Z